MRIDLSTIDRTQFLIKEGIFCGQKAFLVTPAEQGTIWTQANKHLRSSIWSESGDLLSAGFPKFTNAGENPEHFPMPASLDNADVVEKLDGSLAIFDLVNNKFSCRTRGTFTYEVLENAPDFTYAISKYPGIKQWLEHVPELSLLFEITTPNQRIVIDYGPDIELTLVGAVNKPQDYRLLGQDVLDSVASMYHFKRPRYFPFSDLDHLLADVKTWEGLEGCIIYSRPNGMHKVKGDAYLRVHRFKERATIKNVLESWMNSGRPSAAAFRQQLVTIYDHECLTLVEGFITDISLAWDSLSNQLAELALDIEPLKNWARRDAAFKIQADYTEKGLTGAAFNLLSNHPVDERTIYKLMEKRLGL